MGRRCWCENATNFRSKFGNFPVFWSPADLKNRPKSNDATKSGNKTKNRPLTSKVVFAPGAHLEAQVLKIGIEKIVPKKDFSEKWFGRPREASGPNLRAFGVPKNKPEEVLEADLEIIFWGALFSPVFSSIFVFFL